MSLHAPLFPCDFTSLQKLTIINISELLKDLLPEILEIHEFSESLNEVDISTMHDDLMQIVNNERVNDRIYNAYILSNVILKMTFTIKRLTPNGCCHCVSKTMTILDLNERLKCVYKESYSRYLLQ